LGELTQELSSGITASVDDNIITVQRPSETKEHKAKHGLYRALINNMVLGVSTGWTHSLELVGVGYRASNQGQLLDLSLGYSHNFLINVPSDVKVETTMEKGKNPIIKLTSHDKQLVGAVTAKIRSLRKPEPYKGKGVKFVGEQIRRKAGKSAAK
jgi:large subunit ribosomal protein L6